MADINKSMAAERGQNRQQRAAKKAVGEGPAPRRIPSRRWGSPGTYAGMAGGSSRLFDLMPGSAALNRSSPCQWAPLSACCLAVAARSSAH